MTLLYIQFLVDILSCDQIEFFFLIFAFTYFILNYEKMLFHNIFFDFLKIKDFFIIILE